MNAAMTFDRHARDHPMKEPRVGGSVWPGQSCPVFTPRCAAFWPEPVCWYCKYADFHLKERVALEVGICCWPKKQMD